MTLSEMLDALEGGIVALHADRARLASELSLAQRQEPAAQPRKSALRAKPKAAAKPKASKAEAAKPKAANPRRARPEPALETPPPVEAAPAKPPRRRQALGTTLAQLRGMPRRPEAAESSPNP